MSVTRPRFLSALSSSLLFAAIAAPGCSSSGNATPQVGMVWIVQPGDNAAQCPVAGADTFTIGSGDPDDSTVPTGGKANGVPITVHCTVSGNDSSGYDIYLNAVYGNNLASFTVPPTHITSSTSGSQSLLANFNDDLPNGLIATLGESDCSLTYPDLAVGMGIAAGRIWAHIDCPTASEEPKYSCDASATFRFENCTQ